MKKAKPKTTSKTKSKPAKAKSSPARLKSKKISVKKITAKPLARRKLMPVRMPELAKVSAGALAPGNNYEETKFSGREEVMRPHISPEPVSYHSLPQRYGDNRITLLPRDPWWLHSYWDITEQKVNEVCAHLAQDERARLKWVLRVYDVSGIKGAAPEAAHSFFDLDINVFANSWYINVNQPERSWCVDIGLKDPSTGKFYLIARSNVVKTPYFGISSLIDEEWALPDEDYFKLLGLYDLSGKSSLQVRKRLEEFLKQQISSQGASWGISSLFSERPKPKDKFFLEVWTELILYGRTEPDAEVTVEGKKVDLRGDGTFSARYALPEGDFKFAVSGTSKNKKHNITKTPAVKRYEK